jgi:hypothetical protein
MKNDFWGGLSKVLYFFGVVTLIMEFIVFSEFGNYIDSSYWALGAAVMWLLFVIASLFFIVGANIKHLPAPKKYQ